MDERQSFFEDDDNDTLLFEKLQEHVLEKYPNPERIGCIDHIILKAWVNTPEKLDLTDPKYLHVLKCAECTRELIELRRFRNEQSARAKVGVPPPQGPATNWRRVVFAAIPLCLLVVAGVIYWRTHSVATPAQVAQSTQVAVMIDLSQAGTTRGSDTSTVPVGTLPRRVVNAHVVLPSSSPGGLPIAAAPQKKHPAVLSQRCRDFMLTLRSFSICATCRRALTSSPRPMRETQLRISIH